MKTAFCGAVAAFLLAAGPLAAGTVAPMVISSAGCSGLSECFDLSLNPQLTFAVDYNGFIGSPSGVIQGLSAQAIFSDFDFSHDVSVAAGQTWISATRVAFSFELKNTSSTPIDASRVSGMGFLTSPDLLTDVTHQVTYFGAVIVNKSYPNGIGDIDFCFVENTGGCAGGGGYGVAQGQAVTGTATLYFPNNTAELRLDDFFVRYQGIESAGLGITGGSATSEAVVPEPGSFGALAIGLTGLFVCIRRRRAAAQRSPVTP